MSLPLLQLSPVSTSHYYTSGDVTIQDGAAIAPGVLIQADPDSRVIIKTGACIGIGSILHAHQGTVEVGEGANIGAEVMLIGNVSIGANACIGAATTVLNSSIELGRVIPPGSLIGDSSRPHSELQVTDTVVYPAESEPVPEAIVPTQNEPENGAVPSAGINVYGQVYVNNLLMKMFPGNPQSSASSPKKQSASEEDPWDD